MVRAWRGKKTNSADAATELSQRSQAVVTGACGPALRGFDVIENGRHALQVHASLYPRFLGLLQRDALLAMSVRALEIVLTNHGRRPTQAAPMPAQDPQSSGESFWPPLRASGDGPRATRLIFRGPEMYESCWRGQLPRGAGAASRSSGEPSVCRPVRLLAGFVVHGEGASGREPSADGHRGIGRADRKRVKFSRQGIHVCTRKQEHYEMRSDLYGCA